jgi:hypothetical protein
MMKKIWECISFLVLYHIVAAFFWVMFVQNRDFKLVLEREIPSALDLHLGIGFFSLSSLLVLLITEKLFKIKIISPWSAFSAIVVFVILIYLFQDYLIM